MRGKDFVFFDSSSTETTSNIFCVGFNVSQIEVQISGNPSGVQFEGMLDTASGEWTGMAMISVSDFSKSTSVNTKGIYIVPLSGFRLVRAKHTGSAGSVKVYGVCEC